MFWNLFRGKENEIEVREEKMVNRKKYKAVIVLIIAAICLLVFSGGDKKDDSEAVAEKGSNAEWNLDEYTDETQKRLKSVLSGIKGAGNVEVMISLDTLNEKVLATNSKNEKQSDTAEGKNNSGTSNEENVMIYGSGANEQPFVLKEKLPVPSGVLVLAEGAADENVKMEIYESVKALYGISAHRIKVARLNVK